MTTKKILISLLVVVLVAVGAAVLWQNRNALVMDNPEDVQEYYLDAEVVEVFSDRIKARIGRVGEVEEPEDGQPKTQYLEYEKWVIPNEQTAVLFVEDEVRIGTNLQRFTQTIKPGDTFQIVSHADPFAQESFVPYQIEFETDVEEYPFEDSSPEDTAGSGNTEE